VEKRFKIEQHRMLSCSQVLKMKIGSFKGIQQGKERGLALVKNLDLGWGSTAFRFNRLFPAVRATVDDL